MTVTRRKILALGAGTLAFANLTSLPAFASVVEDQIAAVTGGAAVQDGGITLTAPEIAENGNTVPVEVLAEGAVAITILATGNPSPEVATFRFGALNPTRRASTRIRLAKTQDVIAIAEMADGTFRKAQSVVKVTIGGCGG
ncbi:thiosulfate oxidation carrier protein SoxY [Candidatus Halocynthiibacter alkanivorans]|uniref:thiosulfate oxidation carrier protein SoxY n=1 Tax=Candidatus Halocynthiibacter alkanivorans TaxID=2267619 RepID=UPI000DF329D0|nr:thiosulfate oxidation carrier protein SoxY [Candidatus Halocynthiibacter alkanivorans]